MMQAAPVRRFSSNLMILVSLIAAVVIVAVLVGRLNRRPATERIGFQDADFPLAMPAGGEIDHRFSLPYAWQAARIPTALRFDPPMGSEHGALAYNAQKYWEMNKKRGGRHLGDDLNGIGGMDTDLGDPVFAVADGLVLYAGEPSPGWGRVVVIAHRSPAEGPLHSMYAHLHRIDVAVGSQVPRGTRVGTVGTANGYYPAHLHFELRRADGVDIGGGYGMEPLNRLDPAPTLTRLRGAATSDLSPAPLTFAQAAAQAPWTSLEVSGAEKFPGLAPKSGD